VAREAANAAKASADHIIRVERAYIYGGFGPQGDRHKDGDNIRAFVTLANYGRTPGFVKRVEVGSGRLSELPDGPVYTSTAPVSDLYFPGMTMKEVRVIHRAEVVIPADGHHAVFQRVFYTDVLGKAHYSGSIYRLFIDDGQDHVGDEAVMLDSEYWATDETEPKNENDAG
jgi:hypothetical protein